MQAKQGRAEETQEHRRKAEVLFSGLHTHDGWDLICEDSDCVCVCVAGGECMHNRSQLARQINFSRLIN